MKIVLSRSRYFVFLYYQNFGEKPKQTRHLDKILNHHADTSLPLWAFLKIFLCQFHLISFLLFFFQNNLRQTVCTIQYRKFDTFGNDALPQNAVSILEKQETRGNYSAYMQSTCTAENGAQNFIIRFVFSFTKH